MDALVFDLSIPKYLVARAAGSKRRRLHLGPGTCTSVREVAAPKPHDDAWAVLAPELVGLCGTDLATVFFKLSPALSAVTSSPSVLGHEIFARVERPARRALDAMGRPVREGDRVVVDPFVGCCARGMAGDRVCASCASGHYSTCERAGVGPRKGMMLGRRDRARWRFREPRDRTRIDAIFHGKSHPRRSRRRAHRAARGRRSSGRDPRAEGWTCARDRRRTRSGSVSSGRSVASHPMSK